MLPKPAYYVALIALLPLIFGSCATVLNGPTQTIHLAKGAGVRHLSVEGHTPADSSFQTGALLYSVARSRVPLVIHLDTDTGQRTVVLKPHISLAFWLNIYFNYGLGMLVDMNSPKRYSYPAFSYFGKPGARIFRKRFNPIDKGVFRISTAVALVHDIDVDCPERQYHSSGLFGLEAGADYFYAKNRYVSFSAGASTNRGLAEYLGSGYATVKDALYLNARNNHVVGSFDLGYGLSFSRLRWRKFFHGMIPASDTVAANTGLGLSFSADYRLGEYFRLGVLYQPGTWSPRLAGNFSYQHYFSLRLLWRLPLNKK